MTHRRKEGYLRLRCSVARQLGFAQQDFRLIMRSHIYHCTEKYILLIKLSGCVGNFEVSRRLVSPCKGKRKLEYVWIIFVRTLSHKRRFESAVQFLRHPLI